MVKSLYSCCKEKQGTRASSKGAEKKGFSDADIRALQKMLDGIYGAAPMDALIDHE